MSSSIFNAFLLVFTLGLSALFIWLVLYISGYWDINEDKNTNSSKTVPCVAKEVCKDPYQNCVKRVKKSNLHTDTIIIGFKGSGKVRFFCKAHKVNSRTRN